VHTLQTNTNKQKNTQTQTRKTLVRRQTRKTQKRTVDLFCNIFSAQKKKKKGMDLNQEDFSFLDRLFFVDSSGLETIHGTPSLEHGTPSLEHGTPSLEHRTPSMELLQSIFQGNGNSTEGGGSPESEGELSFLEISEIYDEEITVDNLGDLVFPSGVTVSQTVNEAVNEEALPRVVEQPKRKAAGQTNTVNTREKKKPKCAGIQLNNMKEFPYSIMVDNKKTFCTPASSYAFSRLDDRAILTKMSGKVGVNINEVTCQMCKGVTRCQCTFLDWLAHTILNGNFLYRVSDQCYERIIDLLKNVGDGNTTIPPASILLAWRSAMMCSKDDGEDLVIFYDGKVALVRQGKHVVYENTTSQQKESCEHKTFTKEELAEEYARLYFNSGLSPQKYSEKRLEEDVGVGDLTFRLPKLPEFIEKMTSAKRFSTYVNPFRKKYKGLSWYCFSFHNRMLLPTAMEHSKKCPSLKFYTRVFLPNFVLSMSTFLENVHAGDQYLRDPGIPCLDVLLNDVSWEFPDDCNTCNFIKVNSNIENCVAAEQSHVQSKWAAHIRKLKEVNPTNKEGRNVQECIEELQRIDFSAVKNPDDVTPGLEKILEAKAILVENNDDLKEKLEETIRKAETKIINVHRKKNTTRHVHNNLAMGETTSQDPCMNRGIEGLRKRASNVVVILHTLLCIYDDDDQFQHSRFKWSNRPPRRNDEIPRIDMEAFNSAAQELLRLKKINVLDVECDYCKERPFCLNEPWGRFMQPGSHQLDKQDFTLVLQWIKSTDRYDGQDDATTICPDCAMMFLLKRTIFSDVETQEKSKATRGWETDRQNRHKHIIETVLTNTIRNTEETTIGFGGSVTI
jgi:hypothetical protein